MEFEIGQIFEGSYPPAAAQWCNEHQDCYIEEIELEEGMRRFQIVEILQPTEEQRAQEELELKINEIKMQLKELDLKTIRAIRASEAEYIAEYENQAQTFRAQLAELEG